MIVLSIGQVYKAELREGGQAVAVKVQRPLVLQTVACDLFLIRRICVALRAFTFVSPHFCLPDPILG